MSETRWLADSLILYSGKSATSESTVVQFLALDMADAKLGRSDDPYAHRQEKTMLAWVPRKSTTGEGGAGGIGGAIVHRGYPRPGGTRVLSSPHPHTLHSSCGSCPSLSIPVSDFRMARPPPRLVVQAGPTQ